MGICSSVHVSVQLRTTVTVVAHSIAYLVLDANQSMLPDLDLPTVWRRVSLNFRPLDLIPLATSLLKLLYPP